MPITMWTDNEKQRLYVQTVGGNHQPKVMVGYDEGSPRLGMLLTMKTVVSVSHEDADIRAVRSDQSIDITGKSFDKVIAAMAEHPDTREKLRKAIAEADERFPAEG